MYIIIFQSRLYFTFVWKESDDRDVYILQVANFVWRFVGRKIFWSVPYVLEEGEAEDKVAPTDNSQTLGGSGLPILTGNFWCVA